MINTDSPVKWPTIGPANHVSADSSAEECVARAKKWLSGCLKTHHACRRLGPPILPTRVISVGACDEDVKLYVPEPETKAEYAALSHCWGGSHPVVLLKANLARMQEHLELDESCRTFREAIDVTRRLGIPYLWIDSLCILQDQDDGSDWEAEAPKMSAVYNRATVTISAASSPNTAGGLFPRQEDRKEKNKVVAVATPGADGAGGRVFVRVRNPAVRDVDEMVHSSTDVEVPHLRSRGWILQEDHLSPRMLHFRKEELAWTCSTYTRCECRVRPGLPRPHPFRADPGTMDPGEKPAATYKLGVDWPDIVMEYSRRSLTKDSDRIAALSGLANYMEECTTDTYYAGMWYEDLRYQLMWHVDVRNPEGNEDLALPTSRFPFPYAPSWSWMSVPGPITYFQRDSSDSAPFHPASQSRGAVQPVGIVVNVGRFPTDWGNLVGPLLMAPLFLITQVLPIKFDPETKNWTPGVAVADFGSDNLRVYIDVEEDRPEDNADKSFALVLVGRWTGTGMTILCMESVCILARRMTAEQTPLVELARRFQLRCGGRQFGEGSDMMLPEFECSYERVGLVRGAGSLEAWRAAGVGNARVFLF
jgi:hypothetical protein